MVLGITKNDSAAIGAALATVAYCFYANKYKTDPKDSHKNFVITNALAALSATLGMFSKTSSLGWPVRALAVFSVGATTMIPTFCRVSAIRERTLAKEELAKADVPPK